MGFEAPSTLEKAKPTAFGLRLILSSADLKNKIVNFIIFIIASTLVLVFVIFDRGLLVHQLCNSIISLPKKSKLQMFFVALEVKLIWM